MLYKVYCSVVLITICAVTFSKSPSWMWSESSSFDVAIQHRKADNKYNEENRQERSNTDFNSIVPIFFGISNVLFMSF